MKLITRLSDSDFLGGSPTFIKFMILRDKTILEEGLEKLARAGTIA